MMPNGSLLPATAMPRYLWVIFPFISFHITMSSIMTPETYSCWDRPISMVAQPLHILVSSRTAISFETRTMFFATRVIISVDTVRHLCSTLFPGGGVSVHDDNNKDDSSVTHGEVHAFAFGICCREWRCGTPSVLRTLEEEAPIPASTNSTTAWLPSPLRWESSWCYSILLSLFSTSPNGEGKTMGKCFCTLISKPIWTHKMKMLNHGKSTPKDGVSV